MIVEESLEDIFEGKEKHVIFDTSLEMWYDTTFSRKIQELGWTTFNEIKNTGYGQIISQKIGDKNFYALVIRSIFNGWAYDQYNVLLNSLNNLDIPEDEKIAIVNIGAGRVGRSGAYPKKIRQAMEDCNKKLVLYKHPDLAK